MINLDVSIKYSVSEPEDLSVDCHRSARDSPFRIVHELLKCASGDNLQSRPVRVKSKVVLVLALFGIGRRRDHLASMERDGMDEFWS